MSELWEQLRTLLSGNQFLSGGFVLMVLGAAAALARQWPARAWQWCLHRLFIEVEVPMSDEAFFWVYDWLALQPYGKKRSRSLSVRTFNSSNSPRAILKRVFDTAPEDYIGDRRNLPDIILSPAPGTHWLFWQGTFLSIRRVREQADDNGSSKKNTMQDKERFYINALTRNRAVVLKLLCEARDLAYPPEEKTVSIYIPAGHASNRYWECSQHRQPRQAGSLVLAEGLYESLHEDVHKFCNNRQWYLERGIPYRRGYLLHGPPGNGKSSTVLALASEMSLNICVINLGNSLMGDEELTTMMNNLPDESILLFEDIDCVFNQRQGTADKENKLTFSGLLNAIDGVAAPEGHVLIMTTNHPENLDPALTRPGRCDVRVHLQNATQEQAERLFLRFFPGATSHAKKFAAQIEDDQYCMAAIQGHLVRNAHNIESATLFQPEPITEAPDAGDVTAEAGETGQGHDQQPVVHP